MRRLGGEEGFTMVEMITTMTILAILSVFSVKPMGKYIAKARQAEAKTTLGHISTLQAVYAIDKQRYGSISSYGGGATNGSCSVSTCSGGTCANKADCEAQSNGVWTPNNNCDPGDIGLHLQGCKEMSYVYEIVGTSQGYYAYANIEGKDIVFGCTIGGGTHGTIATYVSTTPGVGSRAASAAVAVSSGTEDGHFVTEEQGLTASYDVVANCD